MSEMHSLDLPLENIVRKGESKAPSIFFLHGFGSNMQDLYGLTPFFPDHWTCVSLQASIPIYYGGWAWAELDPNNISSLPKPEQISKHQEQINDSINKCIDELGLFHKKVNLLGFSQGGSISIYCGLVDPDKFRSVVSLCGFFPSERASEIVDKNKIKDLKIFMGSGKYDQIVPLSLSHRTRDGLIGLGLKPNYNEYDSEHTIPNDCLNDVLSWLKQVNE